MNSVGSNGIVTPRHTRRRRHASVNHDKGGNVSAQPVVPLRGRPTRLLSTPWPTRPWRNGPAPAPDTRLVDALLVSAWEDNHGGPRCRVIARGPQRPMQFSEPVARARQSARAQDERPDQVMIGQPCQRDEGDSRGPARVMVEIQGVQDDGDTQSEGGEANRQQHQPAQQMRDHRGPSFARHKMLPQGTPAFKPERNAAPPLCYSRGTMRLVEPRQQGVTGSCGQELSSARTIVVRVKHPRR